MEREKDFEREPFLTNLVVDWFSETISNHSKNPRTLLLELHSANSLNDGHGKPISSWTGLL